MSQQNSSLAKGKILFIPLCTHGHINYTVPIAKRFIELYGDRNEVYFALNEEYKNKLQKLVPKAKFIVYENPNEKKATGHWLIESVSWDYNLLSLISHSTEEHEVGCFFTNKKSLSF